MLAAMLKEMLHPSSRRDGASRIGNRRFPNELAAEQDLAAEPHPHENLLAAQSRVRRVHGNRESGAGNGSSQNKSMGNRRRKSVNRNPSRTGYRRLHWRGGTCRP